ncbi:hypothetical protein PaG_03444 [Moesziomyces aphidis]|uniref:Mitochondrial matrix protein frataxin n=2 Tax=Moesziomyces TaxID=63261 RepID=M9MDH6_PSEA3|nr:hypothetical protein PaG_03444 [Moesziomyces aphidis]GAC74443.1 mitochondrial matrix protein frataxin [Moesziomyces antarcticus T-34]
MMLRTTTQRGLLPSAAFRSIPTRSVATPAFRLGPSESWRQSSRSIPDSARAAPSSIRLFSCSSMVAQPTAKYSASPLSDGEYHKLSNQAIDSLTETFETLLEDADVDALEQEARSNMQGASRGSPSSEWDIECASGVMNLRCGVHGTWVINKQPPNKQIWLSSPKSGPKRFDYDADTKTWFCHKEGETSTLHELLQGELSEVFATDVEVLLEDE